MRAIVSLLFVAALVFTSCVKQEEQHTYNTLSKSEVQEGWRLLFDGKTAAGWRGFNEQELSSGWIVEDGCLKSLGKGGDIGGDIVYGSEEFENFELVLEWKLSKGGNSGIFYHVREGTQYNAPYENAPEYQVIDDIDFPQKLEPWQSVGADYAMYFPDTARIVKPFGEWNESRIRFTPEKVEYWLNGKSTLNFVPWSDDWNKRRTSGKWKEYPDYGKASRGYIGLQDHGSVILYKNIRIKKL
jgi:hypothetical protein